MGDYVKINPNSKKGELLISRHVFEQLATEGTNRVSGGKFKLSKPVQATFQRNGQVKVSISITLKKGSNANDICLQIQESVTSMLMAYTESIPFDVHINIVEISE